MLQPKTTFLKDYLPPDYYIHKLDLHFTLGEEITTVQSLWEVSRIGKARHLTLNGEDLHLQSVSLNNILLDSSCYSLTLHELMIKEVPDHFKLKIETQIKPKNNTALSGLYKSKNVFCTQCEAEGFRRITYFLDRPDVLTRYTTTILADKQRYPVLLSNGNLIDSGVC